MSKLSNSLHTLTRQLTWLGYAALYNSMYPLCDTPDKWPRIREQALPVLRPCIDLFLLGRAVPLADLDPIIAQSVRSMVPSGLFSYRPERCIQTNGLVLHPVFGLWLFHEIPNPRMSVYFGQDSIGLLTRQLPQTGGTCLDLCSGPGVQALYAAKQGETVTSVEINPTAALLAEINMLMNGLEDRMDIRTGNLYDALQEERFDRIIANPPLLPLPEDLPYVLVGHGGDDGLNITWRIIDGLSQHLTEQGFAQIIGVGLSDGVSPCFLSRMEDKARQYGLDITVNVVNHIPMGQNDDYFKAIAESIRMGSDLQEPEISEKLNQWLRFHGATEYIVFDLLITHGTGQVPVQDLSPRKTQFLWYT